MVLAGGGEDFCAYFFDINHLTSYLMHAQQNFSFLFIEADFLSKIKGNECVDEIKQHSNMAASSAS